VSVQATRVRQVGS